MNKVRLIFSYYIIKDLLDSIIYKYHLTCINQYVNIFDYIDFYLCIDDINDIETIEYAKQFILNSLSNEHTNINFIIMQNDNYIREGNVYYNQLILRLKEYADNNELVMFSHTKGLT